jgi:signal transduction histidine kinase
MRVPEILREIRPTWVNRVANNIAHGAGVRDNILGQLERFFDLLSQSVETGNPSWVDPILVEWSSTLTPSDFREGDKSVSVILNHMLMTTYELLHEDLPAQDALDTFGSLLSVFLYAIDKAAHHEMETSVAYAANELTGAQRKLERLDRSKSNFISVAAHELKTPLTLVEGYTSMMAEIARSDSNQRMDLLIEGVNHGIRRLRSIMDDMIDVSLIDNNMLALNFQPFWVNQLLDQVRDELVASVISRKQTLELRQFLGSDQMLFGDPERLYQAFRNVINNAIKYTPDRGSIIVDGRTLPGFIEITFADTGIGISPEDQVTIFEKFHQVGNVSLHSSGKTKFKGGGPGLGLPIARGIIEAHGGAIWVESVGHDENRCPGSTFHVLLPILTEPPDPKLAKLFGMENKTAS